MISENFVNDYTHIRYIYLLTDLQIEIWNISSFVSGFGMLL